MATKEKVRKNLNDAIQIAAKAQGFTDGFAIVLMMEGDKVFTNYSCLNSYTLIGTLEVMLERVRNGQIRKLEEASRSVPESTPAEELPS